MSSNQSADKKLKARGKEALREGRDVAEQAADKASATIGDHKSAFAAQIADISKVAKNAADDLREREQGFIADWVEQAAEQAHRVSESLRDRDLKVICEGVGDFARRQPALFIGGTALLGFAVARLAKASSQRRAGSAADDSSAASVGTLPHQKEAPHG